MGMRVRAAAVAIGACVGLLGLAVPGGATGEATCGPVVELPGVGPACREDGLWRVVLPDGTTELTHGPDPAPPADLAALPLPALRVPPSCVGPVPAPGDAFGVLVYARATDHEDRYDQTAPEIRAMLLVANAWLFLDGLKDGSPARYRMLCDEHGLPMVRNAVLPTPLAGDSAGTIFRDLKLLGYNSTQAKYWVWYDGQACGCAGIGTINGDSRLVPDNKNNVGPDWGITFGYHATSGARIMMHENGHNLGAVQLDAPNTSGAWHCNDGRDVMCYDDGGPTSFYDPSVCPSVTGGVLEEFDCNGDDFFNTNPPAGSYLASHWNLGSPLHKWVQVGV